MKKSLLAILLALTVIITGLSPKTEAMSVDDTTTEAQGVQSGGGEKEKNSQFLVKINYGIDSLVSYDANVPVQVVITNQGEDFTGELTLTVNREYAKSYGYCNDISIPAGTTKTSFLTIPIAGMTGSVDSCIVRILDDGGHILYERSIMNALQFNYGTIVGVLSDDYPALNYLDGMVISGTKSADYEFRIGQMTEETMPDIASALNTCKVIVIDNFDTSKLSDAQYQALRQWVEGGGLLIVGTGAEYRKTLSKFQDDFISGSAGALGKKAVTMSGQVNVNYYQGSDDQRTEDIEDDMQAPEAATETASEEATEQTPEEGTEAAPEEGASQDIQMATRPDEPNVSAGTEETLSLDVLDISVDKGEPVEEVAGGELFIEKSVGVGKVVVCKTALSMDPFSRYASNANVIAGLLNAVLTDDMRNAFSDNSNIFMSQSTIDSADKTRIPKTGKYIILFIIYIMLVGPGIYLVLRWKDRSKVLWMAIPAVAIIFTLGVYVVSINDTVRNPILTSYSLERYDDASKTTLTGLSIVNPRSAAYEVNLDARFTDVRPLENVYYYNRWMNTGETESVCMIKEKVDGTQLKFNKEQAFTSTYMQAVSTEATEQNLDIDIKGYRDGFTGTVTNRLGCDLINVVIYVGGYGVYFNRISAGETVELVKDSSQKPIYDTYQIREEFLGYDAYRTDRESYNRLNALADVMNNDFYSLTPGEGFIVGYKDGVPADISPDKRVVEHSEIVALKKFEVKYADVKGRYSSNIHRDYLKTAYYEWDTQGGYMWDWAENEVVYDFGKDGINTLYYIGLVGYNSGMSETECYIWNPQTADWDKIFTDKDEPVDLTPYFLGDDKEDIRMKFSPTGNKNDGCCIPTIAGGEN